VEKSLGINFDNVSVVLPALNEEVALAATILHIQKHLTGCRILVIDNGSDDRTSEVAIKLNVEVFQEPQRGKGFAVRRGFRELNPDCQIVFLVDADDTYEIEKAATSISLIQNFGYGMVVGTRIPIELSPAGRKPAYKFGHTLGNKILTSISKLLAPTGVNDSLSGWRVMSRQFVNSFNSTASGFEIEAELNSHAYLLNCPVKNIDVVYQGRNINSSSKLNTYSDGLRILRRSFFLFRNNRPHLAFNCLALPWFFASVWLTYRALNNFLTTGLLEQFPSLIAGVGTFLVAGMLWVCGMILQRIKLVRAEFAQSLYRGH
jgi:glycosyltransferase involved in cell wall biosynthesis